MLKFLKITEYVIKLEVDKQLSYRSIYSIEVVELIIFKTYTKTNLGNSLIWLFKSSAKVLILFIKKLNSSFCLYMDYQVLNYLIIKN